MRALRRRVVAGIGVESSAGKSCENGVGGVLAVELEEPVDDPRTTIGTYLSVSHSREVLAGVSLDADTPSCTRFSVKSSNHPGRSRNRFSCTGLLVLRRRMVAGLDVESSVESCGNDVGDVLVVALEEPVVNPGTTIGT